MLRNLSKIFLLFVIISLTSCQSDLERIYIEKCPEAATIPIDKITTESTCQGIPIPFAAFHLNVLPGKRLKLLNESPGGLEDIVKRLHPLTKLPLSMDIALYGKEHELEYFFQTLIYFDNPNATIYNSETITFTKSIYDINRDIIYRDNMGNSILHNFAKNIEDYREAKTYDYVEYFPRISITRPISIRRKALREFYSKLSGLTQIKNQLGQTPMDVASIRKNPASAWELYHLLGDETFIKYARVNAELLSYDPYFEEHPETFEYIIPYIEKKNIDALYDNIIKHDYINLFTYLFENKIEGLNTNTEQQLFNAMENESPMIAEFLLQHNVRLTSPMFSPYRINKRNTVILTVINEEIIKASATTIEDLILKYKLDFDPGVSIKANHIQETTRTLSENYPDEIRIRNLKLPNEVDFFQMNTLFYLVKNLISNPCDMQKLTSEIALSAESTDLAAKNYQSENIFHIIARERISTNKGEKNIAIMKALTPYIKDPMLLENKNYKGETPIDLAKKNNKELYRIMKKLL